jgi:hypothetical protein
MPLATSLTDTATVKDVWRKPASTAQNRKRNKKVNDHQENVERFGSKKCLLSEQERERLATALEQAAERLQQRQGRCYRPGTSPHAVQSGQLQSGAAFEQLGFVFLFMDDDVHGTALHLVLHKSSPLVIFLEPLEEGKSDDSTI